MPKMRYPTPFIARLWSLHRMPIRQSAALFLVSLLANTTVMAAEAPSAEDIVTAADQIRFPDEGFQVSVHVTSLVSNRDPELHEYQVLQSGHDKSVVRTLAPASGAGQVMLLGGPDLWVFLPEVSYPPRRFKNLATACLSAVTKCRATQNNPCYTGSV